MKKITLFFTFIIFSLVAIAQITPVTTLNENFDVACATASFPSGGYYWQCFNPVSGTVPMGAWQCTATNGRPNVSGVPTPGMECTGIWSSTYHLDTSFFVTPLLEITSSTYPGNVYFQFDSKTTIGNLDGRFAVFKTVDTPYNPANPDTNISATLSPIIGTGDSTGWVTHQIDLSSYKDAGPFYLAFRYTSRNDSGSTWYLDNISITTNTLNVPHVNKATLPLTVIGNSTASQIKLSYTAPEAASYHIVIYDMVGRKVYDGQLMAESGTSSYMINGLELNPGMYCIKMGNENTYGTVKVIIE